MPLHLDGDVIDWGAIVVLQHYGKVQGSLDGQKPFPPVAYIATEEGNEMSRQ